MEKQEKPVQTPEAQDKRILSRELAATLCCVLAAASAHASCEAMLQRHLAADMALAEERFDQAENAGFRELAGAACYAEAERLVLAYLHAHGDRSNNLWWHAAQMAASAGRYAQAAEHARLALDAAPARDDPLMWNDYVQASIAFFERDRAGLLRHRDLIAGKGLAFWGNRMNLNLLDVMLQDFDRPYAEIGEKAMKRWQTQGAAAAASR